MKGFLGNFYADISKSITDSELRMTVGLSITNIYSAYAGRV